jgi:hypothetical protein
VVVLQRQTHKRFAGRQPGWWAMVHPCRVDEAPNGTAQQELTWIFGYQESLNNSTPQTATPLQYIPHQHCHMPSALPREGQQTLRGAGPLIGQPATQPMPHGGCRQSQPTSCLLTMIFHETARQITAAASCSAGMATGSLALVLLRSTQVSYTTRLQQC